MSFGLEVPSWSAVCPQDTLIREARAYRHVDVTSLSQTRSALAHENTSMKGHSGAYSRRTM
eukprot:1041339-Amorphochlora_amoeboformis.AAC.1